MIGLQVESGIAMVTLARPPVNAINSGWIDDFHRVLDAVEQRDDVRVVHIRSALKAFCAGADLADIRACLSTVGGADRMVADIARFHTLFNRIERLPCVTLVEIGGAALGGGLELGLACDLRIAACEARLGLPEARLGLIPGAGGTQRLTWLAGKGTAARLILAGEIVDGHEALALGIVQWAVPFDQLASRAQVIAVGIAALEPQALAEGKSCIAAAADAGRDGYHEELEATRRLFDNRGTRERISTFLDRTKDKAG